MQTHASSDEGHTRRGSYSMDASKSRKRHRTKLPPTPVTEKNLLLYGKWKEAEKEEENRHKLVSHVPLPHVTVMSRSTSNNSYTSSRNSGATAGEAKRHGPLGSKTKAKAALIRSVVACDNCKARKVTCKHHDFSLLDAAYRAKQRTNTDGQHPSVPSASFDFSSPIQQTTSPMRQHAAREADLRGILDNANASLDAPLSPTIDILSETNTGADADPPLPQRSPFLLGPGYFAPPGTTFSSNEYPTIPLGRNVSSGDEVWECQGRYGSNGGQFNWSLGGEGTCLLHFHSLSRLKEHYHAEHEPFSDVSVPYRWKCLRCQSMYIYAECPQCIHTEPQRVHQDSEWERWYYGGTVAADKVPSRRTASVRASDPGRGCMSSLGSMSSHQGPSSNSGYPSFSSSGWSPGTGPHGGPGAPFFMASLAVVTKYHQQIRLAGSLGHILLAIVCLLLGLCLRVCVLVSACARLMAMGTSRHRIGGLFCRGESGGVLCRVGFDDGSRPPEDVEAIII